MLKRLEVTLVLLLMTGILIGCGLNFPTTPTTVTTTTISESDYVIWKNSEDAMDLNGDRKIDEADYESYLMQNDFDYWFDSENALDLNGDRRINASDFEIYRLYTYYDYWKSSEEAEDLNGDSAINALDHVIYVGYDAWRNSEEAEDLNDDSGIDVEDYEIYVEFAELAGEYCISNWVYDGIAENIIFDFDYTQFGVYLSQIGIFVDHRGEVSLTIPEDVRQSLGESSNVIIEAASHMTFSRISPFIVGMDTTVTVDEVVVNFSLYLTEIENGFSTTYVIGFYEDDPVISFEIIKVD